MMWLISGPQGAGTDEKVLIEILASRTAIQVRDIIAAYKQGKVISRHV